MTDLPAKPTDTAICGLLAAGPLPTAALAARLDIPERTVRHRLSRLRQAGTVVTGSDGRHHLAAPAEALAAPGSAAAIAGPLPARAAPAIELAAPVPLDLAAPVIAPDNAVIGASFPRQRWSWGTGTIRAATVLGLAAVAGIAITVVIRRMAPRQAPSPPPLPPPGYRYPGDPWGGMPW